MTRVDQGAVPMAEVWRGGLLESTHLGHAVICDARGIVQAWGNPAAVVFPRSSCKMIQALPLVESGAAAAVGLTDAHLALSCASHQGAHLHVEMAGRWLADLGMTEADLRCGAHEPADREERDRLIRAGDAPCQLHNNCSGKHSGFLTATRHLKAGPEYVEIDHPLQKAIRAATEEVTGETISGWGIDGCSAPNFAMSLEGLARSMAAFATAREGHGVRESAMHRLAHAMARYPELVAGEGRACTELMRAMGGKVAIKTGAEAVFVAILPEQGLGIALKVLDGNSRASEAAIAALLVKLGVLDAAHPDAQKRLNPIQKNWRGLVTGELRVAPGFV
ncbi:asparaginase [Pseudogemmobacter blasticus]|uniref:L-asparaginase n=1 Tax=Fuscovulum blasticum DSM 2131 TaxID=1188250 RepID=A0A2T4JEX1_FUSBL|nr:asparaginase [Fuscovulum blasticum]PTE16347.1 L-asparaginase [Fuscovulum blasticum DSM 2131]